MLVKPDVQKFAKIRTSLRENLEFLLRKNIKVVGGNVC